MAPSQAGQMMPLKFGSGNDEEQLGGLLGPSLPFHQMSRPPSTNFVQQQVFNQMNVLTVNLLDLTPPQYRRPEPLPNVSFEQMMNESQNWRQQSDLWRLPETFQKPAVDVNSRTSLVPEMLPRPLLMAPPTSTSNIQLFDPQSG